MSNPLFIPTEITWSEIRGKDLEELLYWLFDAMGAKNLEWRIGGKGAGAADQGRDLEFSFYVSSLDGELLKQRWWVEAKGRSKTLESSQVKKTVLNAAGKNDIDVVVIATNASFSNATRDWVKEWQGNNPRPQIKLWEKTELENLCSKNPIAVIRLFGKALSSQGKLEVAKTKFWDYTHFTDEPTLEKLWNVRAELKIDDQSLTALVCSEMANGNIAKRSWGLVVPNSELIQSLANGLLNFLYLVARAIDNGSKDGPIIKAFAYLMLIAIRENDGTTIADFINQIWNEAGGRVYPDEVKKFILEPVVRSMFVEIRDVCANDCKRVSTDFLILNKEEVDSYWNRLSVFDEQIKNARRILTIERHDEPCKVGFELGKDNGCPLCNTNNPEADLQSSFITIEKVMSARHPGAPV